MLVVAQARWRPKKGNTDKEYEDAFYPKRDFEAFGESFRFAIADGATETSYSGLWARLLVKGFSKGWISEEESAKGITKLQKIWNKRVNKGPLPWYAEEKLRIGAFSSLLGFIISDAKLTSQEQGKWSAISFGDSCLFQVRGGELITSFPLTKSADFNNNPVLLSSNPARNMGVLKKIAIKTGSWESGDLFYLMTDALARWFLMEHEMEETPWKALTDTSYKERKNYFRNWITDLRLEGRLHNDDVTLYRIKPYLGDELG